MVWDLRPRGRGPPGSLERPLADVRAIRRKTVVAAADDSSGPGLVIAVAVDPVSKSDTFVICAAG